MKKIERIDRLLPRVAGRLKPRHIRCYDGGEEIWDRFTIVFTGNFKGRNGRCHYFGCSSNPYHPQGFGQHQEHSNPIDYPKYSHLGKKVCFSALPTMVRIAVLYDYIDFWGIPKDYIKPEIEFISPLTHKE